jgi:hypothetical protein
MPVVGSISLHNTGAFVAKLQCRWIDPNGKEGTGDPGNGAIDTGQTGSIDPGEFGCPNGSTVWAYADVVWGDDKQGSASDGLIFEVGDPHVAEYHIHGTTHDDHMSFDGVEPPE